MKIPLPRKRDYILAFLIFGLIIFREKYGSFVNLPPPGSGKEYFNPNLYRVNKGIITDKYIDSSNHLSPTIEFKINDSKEYYYTLEWDKEIYNYIQVSDSIIKTEFGNKIIIRRNKNDSTFMLNLNYVY